MGYSPQHREELDTMKATKHAQVKIRILIQGGLGQSLMLHFSQLPGDADVAGSWITRGVTKRSEADLGLQRES